MIYTSYFSKVKKLRDRGIVPISISLKTPEWFDGLTYSPLAPSASILAEYKKSHDEERYTQRFNREILEYRDVDAVLEDLFKLSGNRPFALICYEAPDKFCHRHLVAKRLAGRGIAVKEFNEFSADGIPQNDLDRQVTAIINKVRRLYGSGRFAEIVNNSPVEVNVSYDNYKVRLESLEFTDWDSLWVDEEEIRYVPEHGDPEILMTYSSFEDFLNS